METTLSKIKETLLMGPGSSTVPPEVYDALSTYTLGHLDPTFIGIMDEIKEKLQTLGLGLGQKIDPSLLDAPKESINKL